MLKSNLSLHITRLIFILATVSLLLCFQNRRTNGSLSTDTSLLLQKDIASKILRFHIIANSDSYEDQALKLAVRDSVLKVLQPYMETATCLEDAINIINNHTNELYECAQNTIIKMGYSYDVTVKICTSYFPIKNYCDVSLPAGEYTALKIIIGSGAGHNWWCVMFPTLCFIDSTAAVLPDSSKQSLSDILTQEEYQLIVRTKKDTSSDDNVSFEFSFRIVDMLKDFVHHFK